MAKFSWSLALIVALSLGHAILAADIDPTTPDPEKGNSTTTTTEAPTSPTTTSTPPPSTTKSSTTTSPTTPTTSGPTPAPTPKPERPQWPYNIGEWSFTSPDNVTCIRIRGAFELYFPYNATVKVNDTEKKIEVRNGTVSIPKDPKEVTVTGKCGELEQFIKLEWISADDNSTSEDTNYLQFTFVTNSSKVTDGKFALAKVEYMVTLTNQSFPNATDESVRYKIEDMEKDQVPLHKSYKCLAKRTLKNENGGAQELKIASSQFEAFRNVTGDKQFSPSEECSLDGVTDIVPIAVGASLAGLVVVVLIAYLIGRRRSRARGYQSV